MCLFVPSLRQSIWLLYILSKPESLRNWLTTTRKYSMWQKGLWYNLACNMTAKKSKEKAEKACGRGHVYPISGSMSSPPSLGTCHSVTSTESRKTWTTTIAAVWESARVPALTEHFQKTWGNSIDGKADSYNSPYPKRTTNKPTPVYLESVRWTRQVLTNNTLDCNIIEKTKCNIWEQFLLPVLQRWREQVTGPEQQSQPKIGLKEMN